MGPWLMEGGRWMPANLRALLGQILLETLKTGDIGGSGLHEYLRYRNMQ